MNEVCLGFTKAIVAVLSKTDYLRKMAKTDRKPDNPAQSKRFIDAAREAEADETEEGADKAFKKVVLQNKKTTPKR